MSTVLCLGHTLNSARVSLPLAFGVSMLVLSEHDATVRVSTIVKSEFEESRVEELVSKFHRGACGHFSNPAN